MGALLGPSLEYRRATSAQMVLQDIQPQQLPRQKPIQDFRKKKVLEVAESMRSMRVLRDEEAATTAAVVQSRPRKRSWLLDFFVRREASEVDELEEDAAVLIGLGGQLAVIEQDTLYLSREVSLQSTASELVSEVMSEISGELDEAMHEAARECSAAIGDLGRAAQASLISSVAPGWREKPNAWEVAKASSRAQKAVEKFVSTYAATPGHVLTHGKTAAGARRRIDEAWRRDALRALNALQRAPEQIHVEMRRLRFQKLDAELHILGLDEARVETLTLADVRAARAARAKEIHPDVAQAAPMPIGKAGRSKAAGRRSGLLARLFGSNPMRQVENSQSNAHRTVHDETGGRPGGADDEAMVELNRAYETVRNAITAPMYVNGTDD